MLDNTNSWKDKMQGLKNHASPIDLPLEWEALESRMDKRKRRKIIFWLWPMMLGLVVILGYFFMKNKTQHVSPTLLQSNEKTVATDHENKIPTLNENISQSNQFSNVIKDESTTKKESKIHTSKETNSLSSKTEKKAVSSEKQVFPNEIQDLHITNPLQSKVINTPQTMDEIAASTPMNQQTDDFQFIDNHTNILEKVGISYLPLTTIGAILHNAQHPNLSHPMIVVQKEPKPFFVDVRTMTGLSKYNYKSLTDENFALVSQRKSNERTLEHVGGRLTIGKTFNHQWYASVGMSYTKLNEKWHSSRFDTTDITVQNQVLETYTNHLGQVVEQTGSKHAKQISKVTQTRYNAIELISATIALGKFFKVHKMRWAVEVNMSIPTYTKFSGQVLDNKGKMMDLNEVYQPFNSLQYGMHTSYIYPVSGNLAIYGGYDYNFSRLRSDLGYFRTHHLHSLSLGMKYFINN